MATDAVMTFSDATWDQDVLQGDMPVLVDFWAEWCQPCKLLTPTIESLAADYEGKARVGKINIDDNREKAVELNVQTIPTVMIFKGGQLMKTIGGLHNKSLYAEALDAAM